MSDYPGRTSDQERDHEDYETYLAELGQHHHDYPNQRSWAAVERSIREHNDRLLSESQERWAKVQP